MNYIRHIFLCSIIVLLSEYSNSQSPIRAPKGSLDTLAAFKNGRVIAIIAPMKADSGATVAGTVTVDSLQANGSIHSTGSIEAVSTLKGGSLNIGLNNTPAANSGNIGIYNYLTGSGILAVGDRDTITSTVIDQNYILGHDSKIENTYGNWLFGQYLYSKNAGVWAFGADDTFQKKLIPFSGSIVFVNEHVRHWISNTIGLSGGRQSLQTSSPHTRDTISFAWEFSKRGDASDATGYGSYLLNRQLNTTVNGTTGIITWANYRSYLHFNYSGFDDIHINTNANDVATKPWGQVTVDNGQFGVMHGNNFTAGTWDAADSANVFHWSNHFYGQTRFDSSVVFGGTINGYTLNNGSAADTNELIAKLGLGNASKIQDSTRIAMLDKDNNFGTHTIASGAISARGNLLVGSGELVVNGGFDSDATWIKSASVTITGGKAVFATTGIAWDLYEEILTIGKTYRITYTITNYTSGETWVQAGNTAGTHRTSTGTFTETLVATTNTRCGFIGNNFNGSIDNVSAVEVYDATITGTLTIPNSNVLTGNTNSLSVSKGLHVGGTSDVADNDLIVDGTTTTTQFKLSALNTAPANAGDTGTLGEIRVVDGFIYVCTATNTWKRCAIATW